MSTFGALRPVPKEAKMYQKECTSSVEEFLAENKFKREGLSSDEVAENAKRF